MPVVRSSIRVVAVAVAFQHLDGSLMMFGSRKVHGATLELGTDFLEDIGSMYRSYAPKQPGFRLEAEGVDLFMRHAEPMAEQPHLTQRGIYLPDMSFRALPAPGEE